MTCLNHCHVMAPLAATLGIFGARCAGPGWDVEVKTIALAMTSQAGTSLLTRLRWPLVTRDLWERADDVENPGARKGCATAMVDKPISWRANEERFAAVGA